jgi:apolipoprotein D and lipocalin family protein
MKKAIVILSALAGCAGVALALFLGSCTSLPKGVAPVRNFDLQAYMGKWYEIARLDHPFERGLQQVTAEYEMQEDGSVRVINRGYKTETAEWKQVEGRGVPVGEPDVGHLKVSFFGPFYSTYCVFELGPEGQYAFVSGVNKDYLWLLAREPEVSDEVWQRFTERAGELGFDTSELIRVEHGRDS